MQFMFIAKKKKKKKSSFDLDRNPNNERDEKIQKLNAVSTQFEGESDREGCSSWLNPSASKPLQTHGISAT